MAEIDTDSGSLADGFQAIAAAVQKTFQPPKPRLSVRAQPVIGATTDDEADVLADDVDQEEFVDVQPTATSSKPKTRSRPHRKPENLQLDFSSPSPTLKEYMDPHSDRPVMEKYLFLACWFKEHGGTSEVGIDHVYTAFKFLGWSVPTNLIQPFRDLKRKHEAVDSGEERATFRLNHIGEERLRKLIAGEK